MDNDAPSAVYNKQNIQKVDVVFAIGKVSQADTLTNRINTFESQLSSASNNFDVMVEKVETQEIGFGGEFNWTLSGGGDGTGPRVTFGDGEDGSWIHFDGYNKAGPRDGAWLPLDLNGKLIIEFDVDASTINNHPGGSFVFRFGSDTADADSGDWAEVWVSLNASGYREKNGYSEQLNTGTQFHIRVEADKSSQTINIFVDNLLVINRSGVPLTSNSLFLYFQHGGHNCSRKSSTKISGIKMQIDSRKSLGEAIQDVKWRDGSARFIIYTDDDTPLEFNPQNPDREADYEYTVAKLLMCNCYLINLGTSKNTSDMLTFLNAIQPATPLYTSIEKLNFKNVANVASINYVKDKGIYLNNNPITIAMNNSMNYITEVCKMLIVPSDWILVGTQLTWNTEYKDGSMNNGKPAGEGDYALNYGEHNGKNIPSSKKQSHDNWDATHDTFGKQLPSTLSITNEFRGEKILAERWRYRHYYTYFDNPTIQEPYHNQWIQDPEEVFNNPGKFRINYKRLDNPLYQLDNSSRRDTSLNHLFAEYRRWSDNYDKEGYNTTPNMIPIENKN